MVEETKRPGRPRMVELECRRKFGVEDKTDPTGVRMVAPGERVKLPLAQADEFQRKNIVYVVL